MRRVVSLVPSITETVIGLGVTPVGVTRFCDAPGVATVGGTKNPDIDAVVALAPDVVLMDKEENRADDAAALAHAGLAVVATDVRDLSEVPGALVTLAEAVGVEPPPPPALNAVATPARWRVFVPIWRRPWMAIGAGTYGSSILSAAGFDNIVDAPAGPYPTLDLDQAGRLAPDLVLAPSEPYPFAERHRAELERVAPVVLVDGRDLFWWGRRSADALERLADLASAIRRR